jgi:hypothetical protein
MSKINGTISKIKIGGTLIEGLTTTGFTNSADTRETTTKDSNGSREYEYSFLNATFTFEGLYDDEATYGFEQLWTAYRAKTKVAVEYTLGTVTGTDKAYTATALITQLDQDAPMEDNVPFTGTLLVDGEVTEGTVS